MFPDSCHEVINYFFKKGSKKKNAKKYKRKHKNKAGIKQYIKGHRITAFYPSLRCD